MEEQNQLVTVADNGAKSEKEKKSLNRRFGFLLAIAITLGIILVIEIVLTFLK